MGNNMKLEKYGKKSINSVTCKKAIIFSTKKNKILAKKLKKTENNKGTSLRKEKIKLKNKVKGTKPIYLENKGKINKCSLKKKGNNMKLEKYGKKSINSVTCKK